jgi:hypothetical protein
MKPNYQYLSLIPNALAGMCNAFTVNESKHGKGIKFDTVECEIGKAMGHLLQHSKSEHNKADGCTHLESAISRIAKAIEAVHLRDGEQESVHKSVHDSMSEEYLAMERERVNPTKEGWASPEEGEQKFRGL